MQVLLAAVLLTLCTVGRGDNHQLLFVKECKPGKGSVELRNASITIKSAELPNEKRILQEVLHEHGIHIIEEGFPITLEITSIEFPTISSRYRAEIEKQGYRLKIDEKGIVVQAPSAAGIFYGIQTLGQLLDDSRRIPQGEIGDWPDLAMRMLMVDPARQNENMNYYRRLIRFCGRHKLNGILIHLTDDQTSCLAHEEYPWLMHPQAWTVEQLQQLRAYARRHHVVLLPEIESFGHARMFVRHPAFREILHQTSEKERTNTWMGTDVPGYTNVLCPASEKTYEYLDKMYERAIKAFEPGYVHIGCDEVDMTRCARCEQKFQLISPSRWFLTHLLRCRELVGKHGRPIALWGDMLLSHPDIANGLPSENTIIYDWHYRPEVSADSVVFFKKKGFEVMGCPALVCSPHMILPDVHNYTNIARFAEIAREHDVRGLTTTIWIPTRYLSDVLWPGIGFAGLQSWAGSQWDEGGFYSSFMEDFFGSPEGRSFALAWTELSEIVWHRTEFNTSCWIDEKTLKEAQQLAAKRGEEVRVQLQRLQGIQAQLVRLREKVKRNQVAWDAIERSAAILAYTMEHLLASAEVESKGTWDREKVKELDKPCVQAIAWIEADWDRNRFANDPNKHGLYLQNQHLLFRFKQMHEYHQKILANKKSQ